MQSILCLCFKAERVCIYCRVPINKFARYYFLYQTIPWLYSFDAYQIRIAFYVFEIARAVLSVCAVADLTRDLWCVTSQNPHIRAMCISMTLYVWFVNISKMHLMHVHLKLAFHAKTLPCYNFSGHWFDTFLWVIIFLIFHKRE